MTKYEFRRVSPFGYLRIKACRRLPEAFRSLPRPSSVSCVKAFLVCSWVTFYALVWLVIGINPITPSSFYIINNQIVKLLLSLLRSGISAYASLVSGLKCHYRISTITDCKGQLRCSLCTKKPLGTDYSRLVRCQRFSRRSENIRVSVLSIPIFYTGDKRYLVGLPGLEPGTSSLSVTRSNQLSYNPSFLSIHGGACRIRTDDPLLAKQVL